MFDQQLTIDGRQEDIPQRHEQPRMFEAPKTIKGQLAALDNVGTFGTCLVCGGAQNATWTNPYLKDQSVTYCSEECVRVALYDER